MNAVIQDLHERGLIYFDPQKLEWVTAEEYLSGNIKKKIEAAQAAKLKKNVADLKQNLPMAVLPDASPEIKSACAKAMEVELSKLSRPEFEQLMANTLSIRFGSGWVPPGIYQAFLRQLLDLPRCKVSYASSANIWTVENYGSASSVENNRTYGAHYSGIKLAEYALNLKDPLVHNENPDGSKSLNATETEQCRNKTQAIKEKFMDWIWADEKRAIELTLLYNNTFNTEKPRRYNGTHLTFPGMNPDISLKSHQKNQVWRIIQEKATGIFAAVGSGKTYTMIAACMELRRLKLCFKPVISCLNSTVKQITAEAYKLYPNARILSEPESLDKEKRKRFLSRIATGDWDLVIISHTQFFALKTDKTTELNFLYKEMNQVKNEIQFADRGNEKNLERYRRRLENRISQVQESERKDDGFTFEQLGIDCIMLDESQQFKNLAFMTKQRGIAGLPNSHSQRSQDTLIKIHYLLQNHGRVVFSTGTPVSNSMAELYTQMRYLMFDTLEELGIHLFDAWCSLFGETVTAPEITPAGKYRVKNRFARFVNLPELMNLFRKVADITTEEMIDLPRPTVNLITAVAPPSQGQAQYMKSLARRADLIHGRMVKPEEDNMLKVTSDGRKCSLDPRMVGAGPNHPQSKLNELLWNVWTIWKASTPLKGTQIIFCDIRDGIYDWIKNGLVRLGIPDHEIKIAQEVKDKRTLYAQVNKGQVRVIIGSTQTLGTGVNVQERMIAEHDYDAPWRPSDVTQRMGRIARQGNQFKEVFVFRYVMTGPESLASFDSFSWQVLETKAKFIAQIWQGGDLPRSAEDTSGQALTYAQVKALATGDPIMMEQAELQQEQSQLMLLYKAWTNEQTKFHYEKQQAPKLIKSLPPRIEELENTLNNPGSTELLGMKHHTIQSAAEGLHNLRKKAIGYTHIGTIKGFPVKSELMNDATVVFRLAEYPIKLGSVDTMLESITKILEEYLPQQLERLKKTLENAHKTLNEEGQPFAHAERLKAVNKRLQEIHQIIFKQDEAAPGEDGSDAEPEEQFITEIMDYDHGEYSDFTEYLKERDDRPEWLVKIEAMMPVKPKSNVIEFPIHKEHTPLQVVPTKFVPVSKDQSVLQGCLF